MEIEISQELKLELIELLEEKKRRERYTSLFKYYPDTGPLRRELYPKHIEFLSMNCREKITMSGNRTGKTEGLGGFETALHLTGLYPYWWQGRRFKEPISAWAAGKTNITVRNILQKKLLGPSDKIGTGLIPGDLIVGNPIKKPGVPDAFESVKVKHVSGGISVLEFKSYESGRGGFEGTEQDLIWLDEEPPLDVYSECVLRTMATGFFKGGMVVCTFTPMEGMSDTCMHLLENGRVPEHNMSTETGRYIMMLTWDDAPHLSEKEKQSLLATIPAYQRQARTTGVPQLGSGAIYPIDESSIVVEPFPLPPFWPKVYGLDVGWNKTAAVWGAWDREADIVYLYSEHYLGEEKPTVHARAIRARGSWIPGVIDPAARGRSQTDGRKLFDLYAERPPLGEGLILYPADNAVESGIYEVWTRMSTGRLKIFSNLKNWLSEFRMYRRDDKGKVVKQNDHCLVGSTPVWTSEGIFNISSLVGTTGKVLSHNGKYESYKNCKLTQKKAKIVEVEFEDGSKIRCTPDHRFMTQDGWVPAIALTDCLCAPVLMRCLRVKNLEKLEDVYCLDVPETNSFAAGHSGIIVHNCMDVTRYLCSSGLQVAKTDPDGNYEHFVERYEAAHDGYRRAIDAISGGKSWNDISSSYH